MLFTTKIDKMILLSFLKYPIFIQNKDLQKKNVRIVVSGRQGHNCRFWEKT